ncbi:MAG: NADH-quinone oxidoreductase subunit N [Verrucomicrobia bacterium]|nr:NADH-quinone oxidoreductase subunit N [Verrucomicrobiota bacterium]
MNPIYLEAAVVVLGLVLLMAEAFAPKVEKKTFAWLAVAGLLLVLAATFFVDTAGLGKAAWQRFYAVDAAAMFFKRFALLTTVLVLIMSVEYVPVLQRYISGTPQGGGVAEFFCLPIFTCAGLMWMASAIDLTMVFVSLELVTISFYILVTFTRRRGDSLEAGVKYLILGALSTGFLVYGITWTYGLTGQTALAKIGPALAALKDQDTAIFFAFLLIMVALGFKIAAVPFQLWVPDVYQGAPTPITAFLSVGSKAAGFIVMLRILDVFLSVPALVGRIGQVLVLCAAATLIYGNLAALPQTNFKRLLAYSSIAHAGYLLITVASVLPQAGGSAPVLPAGETIAFYLAGYLLMTLLSFTVMVVVANYAPGDDIAHFNGLHQRSPFLAAALLIAMASLAGVPFTVGFFGKFYVFAGAVAARSWLLAAIGVVSVGAGFYYYFKVIRAMYFQPPAPGQETPVLLAQPTKLVIGALAALILLLGVFPQPALDLYSKGGRPAPVAQTR